MITFLLDEISVAVNIISLIFDILEKSVSGFSGDTMNTSRDVEDSMDLLSQKEFLAQQIHGIFHITLTFT